MRFPLPPTPDCGEERLLVFSCRARGFCPSCHAKRLEEWGEWMRETLLLDVPRRQVVFTFPKMLRVFFKYNRRLLGDLCRCALRSLTRYFEAAVSACTHGDNDSMSVATGTALTPGVIAAVETFGDRINFHTCLHFLVTEGGVDEAGVFHRIRRLDDSRLTEVFAREVLAMLVRLELLSPEWAERLLSYLESIARVTSHIPDKGQVMVRYYGLYANAHRGKVRKAGANPFALRMAEEELKPIPSKGWEAMIRKVYEVDPLICPKCGSQMKVIAFLTDYQAVDRIIDYLKLVFVAEKPLPSGVFEQVALVTVEESREYF